VSHVRFGSLRSPDFWFSAWVSRWLPMARADFA
jgi:hypothetical protein